MTSAYFPRRCEVFYQVILSFFLFEHDDKTLELGGLERLSLSRLCFRVHAGLQRLRACRVLRGQAGVSARNAEKVRESARKLGYVANRIAGALAGAPVPLVAVVVPSLSAMVFPVVLVGLAVGFVGTLLK